MNDQKVAPSVFPSSNPIVDMHCHVAGIGAGGSGCWVSPALKNNFRYGIYLKAFGVTRDELMERGDSLLIERLSANLAQSRYVDAAVALALDGVVGEDGNLDYSKTEVYIPNSYVQSEVARHDNLYFGASINPYRPNALDLLDEAAENGAVFIKWLPSIQHIDPADESLIPFYYKLVDLNLPLLTHTGDERSFTKARHELADPNRLELALQRGVRVIAAHVASRGETNGRPDFLSLLSLFDRYPNLYGDISSLTQINRPGHLAKVLKHTKLYSRLLYGTDMPLIATPLVSSFHFLTKISLKKIFHISATKNCWDQDVLLKRALGMPEEILTNSFKILIGKTG
ncbi:MAG: amidohydrolase family protein [Desulfobulbaceae bacterium]|nr:amidohydrolase family protein [Desulfobulbaceae bacterium]